MDIIMPWIMVGGGIGSVVVGFFVLAAWLVKNEQTAEKGK